MELTGTCKAWLVESARALRVCVAPLYGPSRPGTRPVGQRRAERELSWKCQTIRTAICEWESGLRCLDVVALRRRKRAEERLPTLLDDIKALVDEQSQIDRLYLAPTTASEITAMNTVQIKVQPAATPQRHASLASASAPPATPASSVLPLFVASAASAASLNARALAGVALFPLQGTA